MPSSTGWMDCAHIWTHLLWPYHDSENLKTLRELCEHTNRHTDRQCYITAFASQVVKTVEHEVLVWFSCNNVGHIDKVKASGIMTTLKWKYNVWEYCKPAEAVTLAYTGSIVIMHSDTVLISTSSTTLSWIHSDIYFFAMLHCGWWNIFLSFYCVLMYLLYCVCRCLLIGTAWCDALGSCRRCIFLSAGPNSWSLTMMTAHLFMLLPAMITSCLQFLLRALLESGSARWI